MKPKYNPRLHRSGLEDKVGKIIAEKGLKATYEAGSLTYVTPPEKHRYTPDWKISNYCYIETKGLFTAADRKKMLLVIKQNPWVSILMVFQRNNKLSKVSKTTYLDWCAKNGIQACLFSDTDTWLHFIRSNS